ncbi:terminase large subunit [Neiella sp. HB171785]|uniref:Terminase large subunit n=1 Tax=Neiella litorisoli TaxID=2771431 RepID=A0A8J6QH81_9GAMM|nr:terminase TerL endonuclease subunit [Neiella litorisoli]MBD1388437.1 terminase large subunit [Neiella litorisoli]
MKLYHQYAADVKAGAIPVCNAIQQAVDRWFADFERGDLLFDEQAADRTIKFAGLCRHVKGPLHGQPFKVEPWQAWILANIVGWKWADSGLRRFREVSIWVPRKNGKSFLASVIADYFLLADSSQHDIFSYASTSEQARIVFDAAKQMVGYSKPMKQRAQVYAHYIDDPKTNSRFKPMAFKSSSAEGLNPSVAIADEIHVHADGTMFDTMALGMGARPEALHLVISTAGSNMASFGYEYYQQCKAANADSTFTACYELDDPESADDETQWLKANPNLGVSVFVEELRDTMAKATSSPARYNEILVKRFNVWRNGDQEFVTHKQWQDCYDPECVEAWSDTLPTYIGVDLSNVSDITAVWLVQPTGATGEVRTKGFCYLPEAALERGRKNADFYNLMHRQNRLRVTKGTTVDYGQIERDILALCEQHNVISLAFDPWNASNMITRLEAQGIETEQVRQGFATQSPVTKSLQTAILQQAVKHDGNPLLTWAIGNCVLDTDAAANVKPTKAKSQNKIDPLAALLNAYRTWMLEQETATPEIHLVEMLW